MGSGTESFGIAGIRLFPDTGGTVTIETGTCSCWVTGSSVRKPVAGNVRHQLLEVQPILFGYFELKAMLAAVPAA